MARRFNMVDAVVEQARDLVPWRRDLRALCRTCCRVAPGQPEKGKCEGRDGKKHPAGVEGGVGHEVPEVDRDEEAAYSGQREHQTGCCADVLVLDVAESGGYGRSGGEAEDEEEADSDPEHPDNR